MRLPGSLVAGLVFACVTGCATTQKPQTSGLWESYGTGAYSIGGEPAFYGVGRGTNAEEAQRNAVGLTTEVFKLYAGRVLYALAKESGAKTGDIAERAGRIAAMVEDAVESTGQRAEKAGARLRLDAALSAIGSSDLEDSVKAFFQSRGEAAFSDFEAEECKCLINTDYGEVSGFCPIEVDAEEEPIALGCR